MWSSLRREQREAIGLLQVGTFLEYFDLMLYVHMAVLLNDWTPRIRVIFWIVLLKVKR